MLSTKSADKRKQQMYLLHRQLMFMTTDRRNRETNVFVIVEYLQLQKIHVRLTRNMITTWVCRKNIQNHFNDHKTY